MKRALVTGGSGSIGEAICRRLALAGCHVIVHANSRPQAAESIVATLKEQSLSAESAVFDVTDATATEAVLGRVLEAGAIQILVNNAGIHKDVPFAGMPKQDWLSVIDVSLNGFFNVTRYLTMPMMRTRWGRVISISSVAAITGNRGQVNYAAAKSALHGASKSLAIELASRGITVNVVAPGIIESEMTEGLFSEAQIKQWVPMQRAGRADEVAATVDFLASDAAGYISGQVISVNGAMA